MKGQGEVKDGKPRMNTKEQSRGSISEFTVRSSIIGFDSSNHVTMLLNVFDVQVLTLKLSWRC